jgi:hypothetical protein
MDDEADDQPEGKYKPGIRMAELQPPDEPPNKAGECESFDEAENPDGSFLQHTSFNSACDNRNYNPGLQHQMS